MDKEIELRIESAVKEVMDDNGGQIGIFNPVDIARVSMLANVCPNLVKLHFKNQILGSIGVE